MNWFIFITFLLLKLTGAYPVGNSSAITIIIANETDNVSLNSPPNCDTTHPYCCNPLLNSPSIVYLDAELGKVLNVLDTVCTNITYKVNVSRYNLLKLFIFYLLL